MHSSENSPKENFEEVVSQWKEKSDEELKEALLGLHSAIYNYDCFSPSDLLLYDLLRKELESRGYTILESLLFERDEED